MPMAIRVVLKKTSTPGKMPEASDLAFGELALNYSDGYLFYKRADNTVQRIEGFVGSRGFAGSQGNIGYTGSASTVIGYTGSQGLPGEVGYTGSASTVIGYTGSQGFIGSRGYTGSNATGLTSNDTDLLTVTSGYDIEPQTDGLQNLGNTSANWATIFANNLNVGGNVISFDPISNVVTFKLENGNNQSIKVNSVFFPDGTEQTTKAPKMYTNADAALGLTIEDLLPGDFYYDDGTESIFIMVDTGLGYNSLLDLTVRAPS